MRKGINLYSTYNIAAIIPSIWWLRWASIKAKPFTKQSFIRKKRDHMMVSDCNKLWVQTLPVRGLLDSSLWRHSGHIQLRGNPFGKTKSMLAWESLRIPQVLPCMAEDKHHWATSRRWAVKMMAQWKTYMLCISDCICIFFFFFFVWCHIYVPVFFSSYHNRLFDKCVHQWYYLYFWIYAGPNMRLLKRATLPNCRNVSK